jgi:hypothetical protein
MCTLTYIPTKNVRLLTSNRDELKSRGETAFPSSVTNHKGEVIYFPKDPKAGGSWIALSERGVLMVLINGASKRHIPTPPYRLSRGIVLLEAFNYDTLIEVKASVALDNIEPFTLIRFPSHPDDAIEELRWNGESIHSHEMNAKLPHIWSSFQLYSPETIALRQQWFNALLEGSLPNAQQMLDFHRFGGNDNPSQRLNMSLGFGLKTLSISQVELRKTTLCFRHLNLLNEQTSTLRLKH